MIKINLVSEGRKPVVKRSQSSRGTGGLPGFDSEQLALYSLVAAVVVIGIAFGVWWYLVKSQQEDNDRQIRATRNRVAQLQEFIDKVEAFERKQAELEQKIDVITDLKNSQRGPVEIMDQISRALPELLWLDRLDQRDNQVTLSGRAFNSSAIENFIRNLDESPVFEEPKLNDITQRNDVYQFTLVLTKVLVPVEDEA